MESEITMVRIYLKEGDQGREKQLMKEILNILHDQHRVKGMTVFRGIAGFGDTGEVHAGDILRIMVDLPLVIEFFDEPKIVEAVLGLLAPIIREGRIVQWSARCR
jgi:hypothetical protein